MYTLTFTASRAGDPDETDTVMFYWDTAAPTITTDTTLNSLALDGYLSEDDIAASSFPLINPGVSTDVTSTIDGDYYLVTLKTETCSTIVSSDSRWNTTLPTNKSSALSTDNSTYHVCYMAKDKAGNVTYQAVASEFYLDKTDPSYSSGFAIQTNISDGYLNSSEAAVSSSDLVSALVPSEAGDIVEYAVVTPDSTACNTVADGSYSTAVPLADAGYADNTDYKICARIKDLAENSIYYTDEDSKTITFTTDFNDPTITTPMSLANEAVGGYVNQTESSSVLDLVSGLVTTGEDSVEYAITAQVATDNDCSSVAAASYSTSVPLVSDLGAMANGNYSVCVKVEDLAANTPAYQKVDVVLDKEAPAKVAGSFVSDAIITDLYLNSSDAALSRDLTTAIISSDGSDTKEYQLVTPTSTACSDGSISGSYAASIPNSADTFTDGTQYKVCARITDLAANTPYYEESSHFTVDRLVPSIDTAMTKINDIAADDYINLAESSNSTDLVTAAVASNHSALEYSVALSSVACSATRTWSAAIPKSNDFSALSDNDYRICAIATDLAGNAVAYDFIDVTLDKTLPSKASGLDVSSTVLSDGILNSIEDDTSTALATDLVTVDAGDTVEYKLLSGHATTCDASGVFQGSMINSDEATVITTDGDYKLCVKMTDAAGNPAVFDDTVQFVVDKTAPSITAVSTSSSVIDDGYLNSTEAAASTDLVTSVTTSRCI